MILLTNIRSEETLPIQLEDASRKVDNPEAENEDAPPVQKKEENKKDKM